MPDGYIRALFDPLRAAVRPALTEGLNYRAPEILRRC